MKFEIENGFPPLVGEQTYCYLDYRLDDPERGVFYVGIGNEVRVNGRKRNKYHTNISWKYGLLRKVVAVARDWKRAGCWEIDTIADLRGKGQAETNLTDGGEGTLGIVTVINPETGKTKGVPVGEIPEGCVSVAIGQVTCRNLETNQCAQFRKGEIPPGWVHIATGIRTGQVSCRNLKTGETASFPKGEIPDGWVHVATGPDGITAKTWKDPAVRKARSVRINVRVNGTLYRSTWAAWQSLEIDGSGCQCQKFRKELKAAGRLERYGHIWEVIDKNSNDRG